MLQKDKLFNDSARLIEVKAHLEELCKSYEEDKTPYHRCVNVAAKDFVINVIEDIDKSRVGRHSGSVTRVFESFLETAIEQTGADPSLYRFIWKYLVGGKGYYKNGYRYRVVYNDHMFIYIHLAGKRVKMPDGEYSSEAASLFFSQSIGGNYEWNSPFKMYRKFAVSRLHGRVSSVRESLLNSANSGFDYYDNLDQLYRSFSRFLFVFPFTRAGDVLAQIRLMISSLNAVFDKVRSVIANTPVMGVDPKDRCVFFERKMTDLLEKYPHLADAYLTAFIEEDNKRHYMVYTDCLESKAREVMVRRGMSKTEVDYFFDVQLRQYTRECFLDYQKQFYLTFPQTRSHMLDVAVVDSKIKAS